MNGKKILLTLLATLCVFATWAQQGRDQIQGLVNDNSGSPMIGVTVVVKDSTIGTVTDHEGRFSLSVPSDAEALEFRYIGYATEVVGIEARSNVEVTMKLDVTDLETVQVVAYGAVEKVTVTGAISSVGGEELLKSPSPGVSMSLAGTITGVSTVQSIGQPGAEDPAIYIRGTGSLSDATSSPLVLVDGVEREFSQLDPNEISDITVLKDASATAVFGVRGANGVILVTTKSGDKGETRLAVTSSFSVQQPTMLTEIADSYTSALMYNERVDNDGGTATKWSDAVLEAFRTGSDPIMFPNTDWYDYIFKNSYVQTQHNINISGGGDNSRYFVSMGYLFQDGLMKDFDELPYDNNFSYNRYNYRANLDFDVTSTTKIGVKIGGIVAVTKQPTGHDDGLWRQLMWAQPYSSPGIIDGNPVTVDSNYNYAHGDLKTGLSSFYGKGNSDKRKNTLTADLSIDQDLSFITKGLSFGAKASYNTYYTLTKTRSTGVRSYVASYLQNLDDDPNNNYAFGEEGFDDTIEYKISGNYTFMSYSESTSKDRDWYMEGRLNYNKKIGEHSLAGLLLYNQSKDYYPSEYTYIPRAYVGLVGRVSYNYAKKYLAEFNVGYNGSENFASGKTRFGLFPAGSLGWVASEEEWFKSQRVVNHLKLRASYGVVGNDSYGSAGTNRFLYMSNTYDVDNSGYNFGVNSATNSYSASENRIGNEGVTWETAYKQNYGVDISLLNSRLSLTADYFYDIRKDILIEPNTVSGILSMELPIVNQGEVHNRGYEFDLRWRDRVNEWSYSVGVNFSKARNTIIYMDEIEPEYDYMAQTGRSRNFYYGYIFERFYAADDFYDVSSSTLKSGLAIPTSGSTIQPGDCKYYDLNGDGAIDSNDMTYMGDPWTPEIVFGLNLQVNWRGFGLFTQFSGATNVSRMLSEEYRVAFGSTGTRALLQYMADNRWTEETADTATFPRFSNNSKTHNTYNSSLWLRDSSYIRLKNIKIDYTFSDTKWLRKLGMRSLNISLSGHNLLTFDKMDGIIDPEASASGGETNQYPISKIYSLGAKLNF